VHAGLSLYV